LHWFYYEQVELLISVFIWKGIWDWLETSVNLYLYNAGYETDHADLLSLIISISIGYGIYFLVILYEHLLNKFQFNWLRLSVTREAVYFFSFLSVVAVWRALWDGFDYFFYDSEYQAYIIWSCHFVTFFLLLFMGIGTIIYSAGSSLPDETNVDYNCSVKEFLAKSSKIKFFTIEYFAFKKS
jgi:hypothetical protein